MKKILMTLLMAMVMVALNSCTNKSDKMVSLAKKCLKSDMAHPDELKILASTEPDSAFGNWCSQKEIRSIEHLITTVSDTIMKRTKNMSVFSPEDTYVMALAERQMAAMTQLRKQVLQSDEKGEWTGWKVKIDYQCRDQSGLLYRAERWFYIDKEGEQVLRNFELPLP